MHPCIIHSTSLFHPHFRLSLMQSSLVHLSSSSVAFPPFPSFQAPFAQVSSTFHPLLRTSHTVSIFTMQMFHHYSQDMHFWMPFCPCHKSNNYTKYLFIMWPTQFMKVDPHNNQWVATREAPYDNSCFYMATQQTSL